MSWNLKTAKKKFICPKCETYFWLLLEKVIQFQVESFTDEIYCPVCQEKISAVEQRHV